MRPLRRADLGWRHRSAPSNGSRAGHRAAVVGWSAHELSAAASSRGAAPGHALRRSGHGRHGWLERQRRNGRNVIMKRFMRTARSAILALGIGTGCLCTTHAAFAQDVAAAANAFARAQKAELAGDHAAAAELYELADSLAPAPEALRSALKAR